MSLTLGNVTFMRQDWKGGMVDFIIKYLGFLNMCVFVYVEGFSGV